MFQSHKFSQQPTLSAVGVISGLLLSKHGKGKRSGDSGVVPVCEFMRYCQR